MDVTQSRIRSRQDHHTLAHTRITDSFAAIAIVFVLFSFVPLHFIISTLGND